MPSIPNAGGPYSTSNRKSPSACPVTRVYPWLLFTSTAVAALFCLMYITKPVISPEPTAGFRPVPVEPEQAFAAVVPERADVPGLLPQGEDLPGSGTPEVTSRPRLLPAGPKTAPPASGSDTGFEESNLRVQHVLTAETPGGDLSRIVLDVPVLYQSRRLRWTGAEVAAARALLSRLADYQEKTRDLRAEGIVLLDAWNHLMENSIPSQDLRADSPSLPANQGDASQAARPAIFNTTESIQIRTEEP
jgi:hypothetical protein